MCPLSLSRSDALASSSPGQTSSIASNAKHKEKQRFREGYDEYDSGSDSDSDFDSGRNHHRSATGAYVS
ncbi:hypothetical protein SDJN03_01507, partial [Cucurbita argyrosperma subsp. sororia]